MPAPKNIEQENKPKPSLIPLDLLIEFLEPAYREGTIKYYRESWRLGFNTTDMFDAAIRHLEKYFYQKEDYDQETWEKYKIKKHHLAGALFSIICMLDTFKNHPELENRKQDWKKEIEEENEEIVGFQSKIHPSFSFTTEDLINAAESIRQETNQLKSCDLKTESSETLEIKNET
jgi:hypothetical protein